MVRKGTIAVVGDSLHTGFNSGPALQTPLFGEDGEEGVFVYNRSIASNLFVRLGLSDEGHTPGWVPLTYSDTNWQYDGNLALYYLCNAIKRYLGLTEIRVILAAVPGTDLFQTPPEGNPQTTWYPNISGGWLDTFESKFVDEALATPEMDNTFEFLGTFASVGNNAASLEAYPKNDETDQHADNLGALFTEIESFFLASGGARRVVTRFPAHALLLPGVGSNYDPIRVRTLRRECRKFVDSSVSTAPAAFANLDDVEFNPSDPHFTESGYNEMGRRQFMAWRSAGFDFPNIVTP